MKLVDAWRASRRTYLSHEHAAFYLREIRKPSPNSCFSKMCRNTCIFHAPSILQLLLLLLLLINEHASCSVHSGSSAFNAMQTGSRLAFDAKAATAATLSAKSAAAQDNTAVLDEMLDSLACKSLERFVSVLSHPGGVLEVEDDRSPLENL